jgi:hypothetical protein
MEKLGNWFCDCSDVAVTDFMIEEGKCPHCGEKAKWVTDLIGLKPDEYAELEAQIPRWISVEDELPAEGEWCLLIDNGNRLYGMLWWRNGGDVVWKALVMTDGGAKFMAVRNVTHFMPLPEPPQEPTDD